MSNMLDLFRGKTSQQQGGRPRNTIAVTSTGSLARPLPKMAAQQSHLPRAAAIYGGAAAAFAVLTLFYLIKGQWFTGLVLIVPTCCLAGFAYYYMKG